MKRRDFLLGSSATLLASTAFAGPPGGRRPGDMGRPLKHPYGKRENLRAKLPAWNGRNHSDSTSDSFTMFRGNRTRSHFGSGTLGTKLKLVWKVRLAHFITYTSYGKKIHWQGTGWTGQALKVGDYVYIGSTGGHMHCFEASTGKLMWYFTGQRSFKGSPCFYKNRIYAPNVDNYLRCMDAETGKVLWKWRSRNDIDSSPVVDNGRLYIGGEDGHIKCFDPDTGKLHWKKNFGVGRGEKLGSTGIESSVAIQKGVAYFGHLDGHVRAISTLDGATKWKTKIGGDTDSTPMLVGNRLFVGCQDSRQTFHCLDLDSGEKVWDVRIPGGVWGSAATFEGRVYIGGQDGRMRCFDAATGKEVWQYGVGRPIWSSPSIVDGKLCFGSYDRHYRMLDARSGRLLWQYDMGARSHSGAAIVDGRIWVGSAGGYFFCFG